MAILIWPNLGVSLARAGIDKGIYADQTPYSLPYYEIFCIYRICSNDGSDKPTHLQALAKFFPTRIHEVHVYS